jgi:hypothetical protein
MTMTLVGNLDDDPCFGGVCSFSGLPGWLCMPSVGEGSCTGFFGWFSPNKLTTLYFFINENGMFFPCFFKNHFEIFEKDKSPPFQIT